MPLTQSAKKALRQNIRRRLINLKRQAEMKVVVKGFKKLLADKKHDEARNYLSLVYKKLDKLAKVGFIKRNKAARLKSRLAKKLEIRK